VTKIAHAAIRAADGRIFWVPRPGRHHDVISFMVEEHEVSPIGGVQGFVTDGAAFLDREEAARVALVSGQVRELGWPPLLYSEDLW